MKAWVTKKYLPREKNEIEKHGQQLIKLMLLNP